MNNKLKFTGGEPNVNFDDILRLPEANRRAIIETLRAWGDNYIIQGATGSTPVLAGYVMLDGEVLRVDEHTATNTHFEKVVTYDAGGDKTFNDLTPRQTWQINRATATASSGNLPLSGADRLEDRVVKTIAANSNEKFAAVNIPLATESAVGGLEVSTNAEMDTGTADDKIVTPLKVTRYTGGLLTTILNIGDWNMETTSSVNVPHGLDKDDIRGCDAYILSDSNVLSQLTGSETNGDLGGFTEIVNLDVVLNRTVGGRFDNALFNTTPKNRGYIILKHVPA